jgi:hypothetical protein
MPLAGNSRPSERIRRCGGAAIVEMALAVPLLLSMIVFLTLIGRILTERNRMRAAERTVAWLATRQHDGAAVARGETDGFPDETDGNFVLLLRALHFREGGRSAGIVRISQTPGWKSGLFRGPQQMSGFEKDIGQAFEEAQPDDAGTGVKDKELGPTSHEPGEYSKKDVAEEISGGIGAMMGMFMEFIGGQFQTYTGRIQYGMPLIFPKGAYEFFWGEMETTEMTHPSDLSQARSEATYAWLTPQDGRSGCTFPLIDPGGSEVGSGMAQRLRDMMGKASRRNADDEKELYRPHIRASRKNDQTPIETVEAVQAQLEGLMYYEYFDVQQLSAKAVIHIDSDFLRDLTRTIYNDAVFIINRTWWPPRRRDP